MAYCAYRVNLGFDQVQRMAGALKVRSGESVGEEAAYYRGAANALYMLAPDVSEPDERNVCALMERMADD